MSVTSSGFSASFVLLRLCHCKCACSFSPIFPERRIFQFFKAQKESVNVFFILMSFLMAE